MNRLTKYLRGGALIRCSGPRQAGKTPGTPHGGAGGRPPSGFAGRARGAKRLPLQHVGASTSAATFGRNAKRGQSHFSCGQESPFRGSVEGSSQLPPPTHLPPTWWPTKYEVSGSTDEQAMAVGGSRQIESKGSGLLTIWLVWGPGFLFVGVAARQLNRYDQTKVRHESRPFQPSCGQIPARRPRR